jgi:hypothetical protein
VATATNQTIYNHFTFSITNPNLTLVNSTLQSDGQMALKINIIGSPTTPIDSFLNYSYSDEFNTFSGKLPITVSNELFIGQSYQGGNIGYIYQPGDPGYVNGQTHGLIASSDDIGIYEWQRCSVTIILPIALGTGLQNSISIANFTCYSTPLILNASQACLDFSNGGYDDWFLPSQNELYKLYLNKEAIGGFASNNITCESSAGSGTYGGTTSIYWSSSSAYQGGTHTSYPYVLHFGNGHNNDPISDTYDVQCAGGDYFYGKHRVRAVRYF